MNWLQSHSVTISDERIDCDTEQCSHGDSFPNANVNADGHRWSDGDSDANVSADGHRWSDGDSDAAGRREGGLG